MDAVRTINCRNCGRAIRWMDGAQCPLGEDLFCYCEDCHAPTADSLTEERGKHYGHPLKHFSCTQKMYSAFKYSLGASSGPYWENMPADNQLAVIHGVYMILDKLARASEDPTHIDNWDDIAGYAMCVKRILEEGVGE